VTLRIASRDPYISRVTSRIDTVIGTRYAARLRGFRGFNTVAARSGMPLIPSRRGASFISLPVSSYACYASFLSRFTAYPANTAIVK